MNLYDDEEEDNDDMMVTLDMINGVNPRMTARTPLIMTLLMRI